MKENEIRPEALFDEYLRLAEQDAKDFFRDAEYTRVDCPACGEKDCEVAFNKIGFNYEICSECETLFVNPRPVQEAFNRYYKEAASVKFWATHFYPQTEEQRRSAIFRPRAELITKILKDNFDENSIGMIIDIGAGYGIFCEEIKKLNSANEILAIEPSDALAELCERRGFKVIRKFLEDVKYGEIDSPEEKVRIATCFELLEHVFGPEHFIESCANILGKDGILILTTLNIHGFDLQILWDQSKSIHPPHHINFFNTHSIRLLLERNGFEIMRISTPGKLDVDIVKNNIDNVKNRFVATFVRYASESTLEAFQKFLQDHNMSSHMMVVAKYKNSLLFSSKGI